jgi:hypothetical protein
LEEKLNNLKKEKTVPYYLKHQSNLIIKGDLQNMYSSSQLKNYKPDYI